MWMRFGAARERERVSVSSCDSELREREFQFRAILPDMWMDVGSAGLNGNLLVIVRHSWSKTEESVRPLGR